MTARRMTVGPTVEPVSLAEARLHLRLSQGSHDEDALLERCIQAAREEVEERTWRALLTQTWVLHLCGFPPNGESIRLPKPPLQSVSSIAYTSASGDAQTLDAAAYVVDDVSEPGRVRPSYGTLWPAARDEPGSVVVTFVAGWTEPALVPARARQAILVKVADLYDHERSTHTLGVSDTRNAEAFTTLCELVQVRYP